MDQIGLILVLVYVTRVYLVCTRVFKVVLLVLLGFCEGGVLTPRPAVTSLYCTLQH